MTLDDFHFIRPAWLWALLALALISLWLYFYQRKAGAWQSVVSPELQPFVLQRNTQQSFRWSLLLAAVLCITALAGPSWERLPTPVFKNTSALVIALDLSRSMDADDINPTRLTRARFKVADILAQRPDGETALIVFAGNAFVVTPLTQDTETIDNLLQSLETSMMPAQGSNVASALEAAQQLLQRTNVSNAEILVMTDGVPTEATQTTAGLAAELAADGHRVNIIGIGTEAGAPINGRAGFVRDRQGNVVIAKLDRAPLQAISAAGNGYYHDFTTNNQDILPLLDVASNRVESAQDTPLADQWIDRGPWLLLLAVPLAATVFRRGYLVMLALTLTVPLAPGDAYAISLFKNRNQQALEQFDNQNFSEAAENFVNPEWQAAARYRAGDYDQAAILYADLPGATARFNQGNALANLGQLQAAIDQYDQALALNPQMDKAQRNRDALQALLDQEQDQQQDNVGSADQQDSSQDQSGSDPADAESGQSGSDQSEPDQSASGSSQDSDPNNSDPTDSGQADPDQNRSNQAADSDGSDSDQNSTGQTADAPDASNQSDTGETELDRLQQAAQDNTTTDQQAEQALRDRLQRMDSNNESQPGQTVTTLPPSEAAQETQQWLRRIPDNPGGLLRRKFYYQYYQNPDRGVGQTDNQQSW